MSGVCIILNWLCWLLMKSCKLPHDWLVMLSIDLVTFGGI